MNKNKLVLTIPNRILNQTKNREFYAYFKINKKTNIYCIVLLNKNIKPENYKLNQKYIDGIKVKKEEYQKYALCEHVKISKNKITFKTKLFIEKIIFLMQGKELIFFYDKDIDSIIIYNKGNFEENRKIIEEN